MFQMRVSNGLEIVLLRIGSVHEAIKSESGWVDFRKTGFPERRLKAETVF